MDRLKNPAKAVVFLALFGFLLFQVQGWVSPTWDWPGETERVRKSVSGVYNEPKDSLDAVWLGTSHMQYGVSPMAIYKASGIRSYNLATPGQPILMAYHRLKSVLKQQKPRLVLMDASNCLMADSLNSRTVRWEKLIDSMPYSQLSDKIGMTRVMVARNSDTMDESKEIINTLLPILRYHTNYLLTEDSFVDLHQDQPFFLKGHIVTTRVDSSKADAIEGEPDGKKMKALRDSLAVNAQYLDMIQALCSQNGCELVIVKVPVRTTKSYSGYWGPEKHAVIQEMADQRGIRFLDLNYEDIGLDWTTDTPDAGQHMNAKGAVKVSVFLSEWLKENYGLGERRNPDWDRSWEVQAQLYDYETQYTDLQIQTDPLAYMQRLKEENRTVFVAVCQGSGEHWTEELQDRFHALTGGGTDLLEQRRAAYCALSEGGTLLDEANDGQRCTIEGTLDDGVKYSVTSRSGNNASCSIVVNGMECGGSDPGVYLVVYDKDLRCVVDIATIDGRQEKPKARHDNNAYRFVFRKIMIEREAKALRAA